MYPKTRSERLALATAVALALSSAALLLAGLR